MKKFNRTVGLFLSAVMLAAAVSGCGAKETAGTTEAVASETQGKLLRLVKCPETIR